MKIPMSDDSEQIMSIEIETNKILLDSGVSPVKAVAMMCETNPLTVTLFHRFWRGCTCCPSVSFIYFGLGETEPEVERIKEKLLALKLDRRSKLSMILLEGSVPWPEEYNYPAMDRMYFSLSGKKIEDHTLFKKTVTTVCENSGSADSQ